jgi:hypothetical protein
MAWVAGGSAYPASLSGQHRMRSRTNHLRSNRGFALIALLAILTAGILYFVVEQLDATAVQRKRDDATTRALAEAKAALLGFAASAALPASCVPITGCARPGDLPCPDTHDPSGASAGNPDPTCGTSLVGRLPFKKLGLSPSTDDSGERLWYAVSASVIASPRTIPLNSDTNGSITITDGFGNTIATDVVAVAIAPGAPLQREGSATIQARSPTATNADAYLDIHSGIDNAASSGLTFMAGPVFSAVNPQQVLINDRLTWISRTEFLMAVRKRLLGELRVAMKDFFSNNLYLPNPVPFADASCLSVPPTKIAGSNCLATAGTFKGRIPADAWSGNSSFLNGGNYNWFQINGWRESIYYHVSPKCAGSSTNECNGAGTPPMLDGTPQCVVLVAGGSSLVGIPRPSQVQEQNYFEETNATGVGSYVSKSAGVPFNDVVIGFCPDGQTP